MRNPGKQMNATAFFLMLFAALVVLAPPAQAEGRYAAIVVDAHTGRILHAENATEQKYPASLTKVMTLYMVFEALDSGRLTMNTPLRVSANAAKQPPTKVYVKAGETIRVKDAILTLVTKSANDVAMVVAENLGGSQAGFGRAMTRKARQLGMRHSTFTNPSGLPDSRQRTTAIDMAILAVAVMRDFPHYYHFFKTAKFQYHGRNYPNHNALLSTYQGTDGIKTGYTRASGYNLLASARRDGRRLIGVVFGGTSSKARNRRMVELLDRGFARARYAQASKAQQPAQPSTGPRRFAKTPAPAAARQTARNPASSTLRRSSGSGTQSAARPRTRPEITRPQPIPRSAGQVEQATRPAAAPVRPGRDQRSSLAPSSRTSAASAARASHTPASASTAAATPNTVSRAQVASATAPTRVASATAPTRTGPSPRTTHTAARPQPSFPVTRPQPMDPAPLPDMAARAPASVADGPLANDNDSMGGSATMRVASVPDTAPFSSGGRSGNTRADDAPFARAQAKATEATTADVSRDRPAEPTTYTRVLDDGDYRLAVTGELSTWGVQVGAFRGYGQAEAAVLNAAQLLAVAGGNRGASQIVPVHTDNGTLYRARLMGMEEVAARRACDALRQRANDCYVVNPVPAGGAHDS